jgi:hypothetical protein
MMTAHFNPFALLLPLTKSWSVMNGKPGVLLDQAAQ